MTQHFFEVSKRRFNFHSAHFLSEICRVFCVKFSCDASYVISGSDDTNLRLWKAKASEQLGVVSFLCYTHFKLILAYFPQCC